MIQLFHDLWRKRGGSAAIEFAFVLPVMIVMFMGVFEVSQGLVVYMKVIDVADTVADLIAQQKTIATSDINNYYVAGQLVMTPSPAAGLGLAVASVTFDPVTAGRTVAWQVTRGGAATMTNLTAGATGLGGACVTQLASGGSCDSVIAAEASYTYNSALSYLIQTPITIKARVYSRPRAVFTIPCSPCS
ncbi:MAG: TadE/TadG family type IV pilus assembly protein [Stellaceae bacterium]